MIRFAMRTVSFLDAHKTAGVVGRIATIAADAHPCLFRPAATKEPKMQKLIAGAWGFIFDHEVSPLRHIPGVGTRHLILQILGWMWAVAFSVAIGSYALLPASLLGHAVLIAAAAITTATYTAATIKPDMFKSGSGRRQDGEHE